MINLQYIYIKLFFVVAIVTALLCFAARKGKPWLRGIQGFALTACVQLGLTLLFVGAYVLCVKNGYNPSLSAMGVAFFPLSVLVYFAFWRARALSAALYSLIFHALYTLFLLTKSFPAVLIFNPIYAFLGASAPKALAALTAFLPLFAAALGRSAAQIDKSRQR